MRSGFTRPQPEEEQGVALRCGCVGAGASAQDRDVECGLTSSAAEAVFCCVAPGMSKPETRSAQSQNNHCAKKNPLDSPGDKGISSMPGRAVSPASTSPSPSGSAKSSSPGRLPIQALPLFSKNFLQASNCPKLVSYKEPEMRPLTAGSLPRGLPMSRQDSHRDGLQPLELDKVKRIDSIPTETAARRKRLKMFESECSHSFGHMHLGGHVVAKSREILKANGITHVVNCVRGEHSNYFPDDFNYLGLYLQDWNQEEIYCVFYDCFDFIESARDMEGKVYIHCSQGVSRSATVTAAYIMWRTNQSVDTVLEQLKKARAVVEPNIGFYFQLTSWDKRRKTPVDKCNIYRIAPLSRWKPTYLVSKFVSADSSNVNCLDPRGAFILHCPQKVYVWIGDQCPESFIQAGRRCAAQLAKYENAPRAVEIRQGEENSELVTLLGCTLEDRPGLAQERPAFTPEYEYYHRSLGPKPAAGDETPRPPLPVVRRSFRRSRSDTIYRITGDARGGC